MSDTPILIPCPHCGAINRVPHSRVGAAPSCGRCHQALFDGQPLALSAVDFDLHAVRGELPILVDFWAPWCAPFRTMAPQFEAAARHLEPQVRLVKVDTEAEPALAARFNVRSIPTMVLLQAGREIARQSGAVRADQIVRWTRDQLAQA